MNRLVSEVLRAAALTALLAGAGIAQSSDSANRMASTADNTFINKAASGGMAEVEFGKLAVSNAQSADVKKFGQRMVDDHSKANNELSQLAAKKGITLPTGLDAKDQATKEKLSKLSGAEFDRAYMEDMVKDHRTDVAEFRKEANKGQDAETKSFAAKTLPTLEMHYQMAQSALGTLKK